MDKTTAVFDSYQDAEMAVQELRGMGIDDANISYVAKDGVHSAEGKGHPVAEGLGTGLMTGAGVGALFGLAAVAIPGVGPFITAGWLASALGITGGAAAAGAIVGGTSGAIAGALANAGYEKAEADYYGDVVERGGILVTVRDSESYSSSDVLDVLRRHGGQAYGSHPV